MDGELLHDPQVLRARAWLHEHDAETLAEQVRIAQIAAPPFAEHERGAYVAARLRAIGLSDVHTDEVGNVVARLPGRDAAASPVVAAAHLDTVFAAGTPLQPRQSGRRLYVPGIADNARGLAALLALGAAVVEAGLRPRAPLVFAATVGEEGCGDLRGAKHLLREGSPLRGAAAFVGLDGSGWRRIVHRAVGSRRLRFELRGPGGHSWADWGVANPLHALGAAVGALAALPLPAAPRTVLTVARLQGGSSVNAVPAEAWMELDLRSEGSAELQSLEREVRAQFADAVRRENRRRAASTAALEPNVRVIGDRPAGCTPADAPLVAAAAGATRALGGRPTFVAASTDANVAIALGIPAITLGCGGESGGVHTPREWYSNDGGARGLERVLLTLLTAS